MITPDQLRKCATCVYLAAEEGPAEDIANHLNRAANAIDALTAENRELRELAQELALARELLEKCKTWSHKAAGHVNTHVMCGCWLCGHNDFGLMKQIEGFLFTSRVPGLVVVKSEDLDALKMWYEEIPVSGEPNWQSLEEIVKALTRAKEGELWEQCTWEDKILQGGRKNNDKLRPNCAVFVLCRGR